MKFYSYFFAAICCLGLFSLRNSAVHAQNVIYVDQNSMLQNISGSLAGTSWDSAFQSLNYVLNNKAQSGDQVWVARTPNNGTPLKPSPDTDRNSTFLIPAGVALYGGFNGQNSIGARNPAHFTTLSGDLPAVKAYHVVTISPSVSGQNSTLLDGFQIKDGNANGSQENKDKGGGILALGHDLTLINCEITNNKARQGGGIYHFSGSLTVNNTLFTDNSVSETGGAVHIEQGNGALITCVFSGNDALNSMAMTGDGGAIYLEEDGELNILQSSFESNRAINGGGLYLVGKAILDSCQILHHDDAAFQEKGGGIFRANSSKPVLIIHSIIQQNHVRGQGGGIYNDQSGTGDFWIVNSTIAFNEETERPASTGGTVDDVGGGGICTFTNDLIPSSPGAVPACTSCGKVIIMNTTLSGNRSKGVGAGLYNASSNNVYLIHSTITQNSSSGGDIGSYGRGDGIFSFGTIKAASSMIVQVDSAVDISGIGSTSPLDIIDPMGKYNMVGNSFQNLLSPNLRNNVGFTQTHALLSGSLGIDSVKSSISSYLSLLPTNLPDGTTLQTIRNQDQRLSPRDANPDIGAYEYQRISLNVDTLTLCAGESEGKAYDLPLIFNDITRGGILPGVQTVTFSTTPGFEFTEMFNFNATGGSGEIDSVSYSNQKIIVSVHRGDSSTIAPLPFQLRFSSISIRALNPNDIGLIGGITVQQSNEPLINGIRNGDTVLILKTSPYPKPTGVIDWAFPCENIETKLIPRLTGLVAGVNYIYRWEVDPMIPVLPGQLIDSIPKIEFPGPGLYNISLTIGADEQCTNTLSQPIRIFPTLSISPNSPYRDSLNGPGYWIPRDSASNWELGIPQNTRKIQSTRPVYMTNLDSSYDDGQDAVLCSPCFDKQNSFRTMFSMNIWSDMEPFFTGLSLEGSEDGGLTWQTVGDLQTGANWYPNIVTGLGGPGWTGLEDSFQRAIHRIDQFGDTLMLRFRFVSAPTSRIKGLDGVAIGDFFIGDRKRSMLGEHPFNLRNLTTFSPYSLQDSNQQDLILLQYAVAAFPDDSLFVYSWPIVSARQEEIGITTDQILVLDGSIFNDSTHKLTQGTLNQRMVIDPQLSLQIDTARAQIYVEAEQTLPELFSIRVLIAESLTANGQQIRNLARGMFPSPAGFVYPVGMAKGAKDTLPLDYQQLEEICETIYIKNQDSVSLVVFAQDEESKEVFQATQIKLDRSQLPKLKVELLRKSPEADPTEPTSWAIYPNPANKLLQLQFPEPLRANTPWTLLDVMGRSVNSGVILAGEPNTQIPVSQYSEGLYFLHIQNSSLPELDGIYQIQIQH